MGVEADEESRHSNSRKSSSLNGAGDEAASKIMDWKRGATAKGMHAMGCAGVVGVVEGWGGAG